MKIRNFILLSFIIGHLVGSFVPAILNRDFCVDGLKYWKAMHSEMGWLVEKCEDADEMPPTKDIGNNISYFRSLESCFFLSQIVELPSHGLSGFILEKLTAKITVSIW